MRSVAAQVLAAWRSHRSLPRLRAAFERLTPSQHALRGVLAASMASVLRVGDTEDVVRWFVSLPNYSARHDLLPLMAALPARRAVPLLEAAWADGDAELRRSILAAAGAMRVPERFAALASRDPDPTIRAAVVATRP